MAFAACASPSSLPQDNDGEALAKLEWGDPLARAQSGLLLDHAKGLTEERAELLRTQLESNQQDLQNRMVLLIYEQPELRRKRGEKYDPEPHGRLVLGLIEQHPRSQLAGTAGLLLYAYKRDGMYTGPAWDKAIELWERLVAQHPKDPAILCNADSFLMADPFRMSEDGPRALALLRRARELAPKEPRWALKLGAFHSTKQSMTREPEARMVAAKAASTNLRSAWDTTGEPQCQALRVTGQPLTMVLASAYFEVGEMLQAHKFAMLALEADDPTNPNGDLTFDMNVVLGRIALANGDVDKAGLHLLAAGKTHGSPSLGSFGPDLTLAKDLLAGGQRDTVRQFIQSCKTFWHSGQEQLTSWTIALESGGDPRNDTRPLR